MEIGTSFAKLLSISRARYFPCSSSVIPLHTLVYPHSPDKYGIFKKKRKRKEKEKEKKKKEKERKRKKIEKKISKKEDITPI